MTRTSQAVRTTSSTCTPAGLWTASSLLVRQSLAVAGGEQIGAVGAQLIEREGLQVLLDWFDPLDEGLVAAVRFARRGQQTHGPLDTQCGREYERPVVGDDELVPGSCRRGASRRRVRRSRRGTGRRRAGRTITRRLAVIRTTPDQQNTRNDKHRS